MCIIRRRDIFLNGYWVQFVVCYIIIGRGGNNIVSTNVNICTPGVSSVIPIHFFKIIISYTLSAYKVYSTWHWRHVQYFTFKMAVRPRPVATLEYNKWYPPV